MINPVNNYTQTEYQPQVNRTQKVDNGEHFSLDSALEKQDDSEGVIYERSSDQKTEKDQSSSPAPKHDTFESSLDEAIATRAEREKEEPDELSVAMYAFFDKLQNFFVKFWKNVRTVFGNLWDSKPIAEGLTPEKKENEAEIDEASSEVNVSDESEASEMTPQDFFNQESPYGVDATELSGVDATELNGIGALEATPLSSIDALEASRDADIRKALSDGDKDKFRDLISEGGSKMPAHSTSTITTYDAHGKIVSINPSDENKILHGDRGAKKL